MKTLQTFALWLLATGAASTLLAQTNPPAPINPLALGWPRAFDASGYEFAIYQPSVDTWPGNQLSGRFAVGVRPAGTSNETYGVAFFTARTEIDKVTRLVTLEDWKLTKTIFPTQKGMQKIYQALLQAELPATAKTVPLDHLESSFIISGEIEKAKEVQVDNAPPRIIYTTTPSLLVHVDGAPMYAPLVPGYEHVLNTHAVLLLNTNQLTPSYYLYAASNWYIAPSLEGPWTTALILPSDINTALNAALKIPLTDPLYPRAPLATPPTIYVATGPAELIQTKGVANMVPVDGTDLLYLANTDEAIFYYLDDANYYTLISGRWFKSLSLYGPWSYVPQKTLPTDFAKIPPENPKSGVLCSVAGTPQAQEALIANSIPQTATLKRDQAKLTVQYGGAPQFAPIAGTSLQFATNTQTAVVRVNSTSYYACEGGVWFVSPSPTGPWAVATKVPASVYSIPATCPIHYVTYVYVYGSTPQVVYVGYTPGYMGTVVAPGGVVVYGTGYYYPPVVVGTTYVSYPPTYGYGASLAVTAAAGFALGFWAGSSCYCCPEPHWGCYGWCAPYGYSYAHVNCCSANYYTGWGTAVHSTGYAGYNPYTGTYGAARYGSTYNPYTGTSGSFGRAGGYNPYTGNYAAGEAGSAYNPHTGAYAQGSRGVSGNAYSGNWNAAGQGSGYNPSTGRGFNTSASASGNAYSGNYSGTRSTSAYNQNTGSYGQNTRDVSGNAYNGTRSVDNSGSAYNAKTGNSASWNNGTMTTDKSGNAYTYNKGDTSANQSTWQSAHPSSGSSLSSAQSSWASRESSGQSAGQDRFSGYSSSGGSSWGSHNWGGGSSGWGGGDHSWGGSSWGGGGGWGGFHGGGGGWRR
jgi:hypothetical protein